MRPDNDPNSSNVTLVLRGLGKQFGMHDAVKDVNLDLPAGAFLVLLGPSGCGKSTLLRMLAGLELPSSGSIWIEGREVANGARGNLVEPGQRGLGMVFQSYALWPHMTVEGNVEWPLKIARMPAAERARRVAEVLDLLAIAPLAKRYPNEISGGQQQRVAIARTLSPKPTLLLFDEPLSNLDAKLRVEMRSELLRVHRVTGATSVYVTHDQIEAMTMATHVAVMKDGMVEQFGSPASLLARPASAFVATFVGMPAANVIPVQQNADKLYFAGVELAVAGSGKEDVSLLYAPTSLELTRAESAGASRVVLGTLVEIAPMAGRHVCTFVVAGQRVSIVTSEAPGVRVGEMLGIGFPQRPQVVFDSTGRHVADHPALQKEVS
jgi:iron(III) transport system ATP-binding protein